MTDGNRISLLATFRDTVCDSTLSSRAKLAGLTLTTWMNRKGACYPGIASIARRMSVCENTARKGLRELEQSGYIAISQRGLGHAYQAILPDLKGASVPTAAAAKVQRVISEDAAGEYLASLLRPAPSRPAGESSESGKESTHESGTSARTFASAHILATGAAAATASPAHVVSDYCLSCNARFTTTNAEESYCENCRTKPESPEVIPVVALIAEPGEGTPKPCDPGVTAEPSDSLPEPHPPTFLSAPLAPPPGQPEGQR